MTIPREFIELLLSKIDLVDLIHTHVPLKKKTGSNYFACCPFHDEKTPSFSVSQVKQFYYCFGCGAHGNAIDFVMHQDRLTFPEAIHALAKQVGMSVPEANNDSQAQASLLTLFEMLAQAASIYYDSMRHSEQAIQYLKKRGISGAIAQQFQLGYAPAGWHFLLHRLAKTEADTKKLVEAGLVVKKPEGSYYDFFRDRIMIPIRDYRGRVKGFGARVLEQGEPKYLNSPETAIFQKGHEVFGLYQALAIHRQLEKVLIVEGYMDVIALFQHGITYAVATLGTATTEHHLKRLFRYTSYLIFCFDGDQAGRKAAERAVHTILPLIQDQQQISFLFLPEGHDPDSLIRQEGRAAFEARLSDAISLSAFFFQLMAQQVDMGTMDGRSRFLALALTSIKQLAPGIFQTMLIDELSRRARISVADIKQQLKRQHHVHTPSHEAAKPLTQSTVMPECAPPVRLACALLLQQPSLIEAIVEPLPLIVLAGYDFLLRLIDQIKSNPGLTAGALREYWRGKKEESWIIALTQWEHMIPDEGIKNEFLGAIQQLRMGHIELEINRLLAKAAEGTLTEEEKKKLQHFISKKKMNVVSATALNCEG